MSANGVLEFFLSLCTLQRTDSCTIQKRHLIASHTHACLNTYRELCDHVTGLEFKKLCRTNSDAMNNVGPQQLLHSSSNNTFLPLYPAESCALPIQMLPWIGGLQASEKTNTATVLQVCFSNLIIPGLEETDATRRPSRSQLHLQGPLCSPQ